MPVSFKSTLLPGPEVIFLLPVGTMLSFVSRGRWWGQGDLQENRLHFLDQEFFFLYSCGAWMVCRTSNVFSSATFSGILEGGFPVGFTTIPKGSSQQVSLEPRWVIPACQLWPLTSHLTSLPWSGP